MAISTINSPYALTVSGSVIQTVTNQIQGSGQYFYTTVAGTYQATGHTVTITPKFSTSKILLFVTAFCGTGGTNTGIYLTIYRNSTDLSGAANNALSGMWSGLYTQATYSMMNTTWVDTPATTSATTYQTYIQSHVNGQGSSYGGDPAWMNKYSISFTAMEIAA